MTITRRQILRLAAGLPVLSLGVATVTLDDLFQVAGSPEVDRNALSPEAWVDHVGDGLWDLAGEMANMERQAVRQNPWRTWKWIRYTGCIGFRDGISLVYGHGSTPHVEADCVRATRIVSKAGFRLLAGYGTEDGTTWTVFVLGDRRDVKPLLAGMVKRGPKTLL